MKAGLRCRHGVGGLGAGFPQVRRLFTEALQSDSRAEAVVPAPCFLSCHGSWWTFEGDRLAEGKALPVGGKATLYRGGPDLGATPSVDRRIEVQPFDR